MKPWRRLSVLLILPLIFLLITASTAYARKKEPVGTRINLRSNPPATFPADQPFHIQHGWRLHPPEDKALGHWTFTLEVNGRTRRADFRGGYVENPQSLIRLWTFNFPDGLPAGTYTFTGRWYKPCRATADPCSSPNQEVQVDIREVVIVFTD